MNWFNIEKLHRLLLGTKELHYFDPWFLREFVGLITCFNPSEVVETGTYQGGMLKFLAYTHPNLKLYSCDIIDVSHVQEYFQNNQNVHIQQTDSITFLKEMRHKVGPFPMFYLDAHSAMTPDSLHKGVSLEPLAEEIVEVIQYGPSIVCIHDFEVPKIPEFGHGSRDPYLKKDIRISWEVIKDQLSPHPCVVYFPYLPQRLIPLPTGPINWTKVFDLRGRVYIFPYPSTKVLDTMRILEQFGILWRFDGENRSPAPHYK